MKPTDQRRGRNGFQLFSLVLLFVTTLTVRAQAPGSSGTIITIAGNGSIGYSGDGGPATNASMNSVIGMAMGPDGTLYLADSTNFRIRAIDPVSGLIRTIAGNGIQPTDFYGTGDGGRATNASFGTAPGLAVDRTRRALYFSDEENTRVRRVDLASGIISHWAGRGTFEIGFSGDGGSAADAKLAIPKGLAVDNAGRLLIADSGNHRIRQVEPITQIISSLAGRGDFFNPPCSNAGDGGPALNADFSLPVLVSSDGGGNVFVLDSGGPCGTANPPTTIRRIDAINGLITRVAGGGTNVLGNGIATNMDFAPIYSQTVDHAGNVYLASNTEVLKLSFETGMLTLIAGDRAAGFEGDGGPAAAARFSNIAGLAAVPGGGLVVADGGNGRIRYIAPDSIKLTNDAGQTSFTLPWVNNLSGNLILENNPNLSTINLANLTEVGGDLVLSGNAAAGDLDLGSLETASGDLVITDNTAATVINLASLTTVSGDLVLTNNGASGDLDLASLETVSGDLIIEEPSSGNLDLGSLAEVSGDLTLELNQSGNLDLSTLTSYGCGTNEVTITLDGGTVQMTNGLTLCTNATLTGSTTVDGSITNNGTIEPGSSPGRLNITRHLHLGSSSRLKMEIGGYATNQMDVVNVGSTATLGGTLSVSLINNFTNAMTNGASFTLLTANSPLIGAFANVPSGGTLITTDGRARFTVRYAGENTVRLTNLEILNNQNGDTDGDGMPDEWEDRFGFNKMDSADALLDFDGDGASNRAEYLAGTLPKNAASAFRILAIQSESNSVKLTLRAVGGKSYRVQTNNTPTGAFSDSGSLLTVSGEGESITNIIAPGPVTNGAARFYRIRLGP